MEWLHRVRELALILGLVAFTAAHLTKNELHTYRDHPCIRPCQLYRPMVCTYNFTLELWHTMGRTCGDCPTNKEHCARPQCVPTDGNSRGILTVNRMIPGPGIHVCEGDEVIVNVHNDMSSADGSAIHWHGLFQLGTQHMDGVDMITQCPITRKTNFQYRFGADNAGTHFYHSHSGLQRGDGIVGAFVIRQPDYIDPHRCWYDYDLPEHTMIVGDWYDEMTNQKFAASNYARGGIAPQSMLINGKGVSQAFFDSEDHDMTNETPMEVFHVTYGKRYRFRTISNGLAVCPLQVSIDGHSLDMIASDGNAFAKTNVESFNIKAAERYDFVLNATMPVGNYWVRIRGQGVCGFGSLQQFAILRYEGAPEELPIGDTTYAASIREGRLLNPLNERGTDELIQVSTLTYVPPRFTQCYLPALKPIPDKKFYLGLDLGPVQVEYDYVDDDHEPISDSPFVPQINNISFVLPSSPPMSQLQDIPEEDFCDIDDPAYADCGSKHCQCIHRIKVALNDVVELVMVDEGRIVNANHPFHLHGHAFHVVAQDKLAASTSVEEVKALDDQGQISRNLDMSVLKDTVTIPDGGYSILRFHANNPGAWFFHCHVQFHVDAGMAILIQVGDVMPTPPQGFPKCGDFKVKSHTRRRYSKYNYFHHW